MASSQRANPYMVESMVFGRVYGSTVAPSGREALKEMFSLLCGIMISKDYIFKHCDCSMCSVIDVGAGYIPFSFSLT